MIIRSFAIRVDFIIPPFFFYYYLIIQWLTETRFVAVSLSLPSIHTSHWLLGICLNISNSLDFSDLSGIGKGLKIPFQWHQDHSDIVIVLYILYGISKSSHNKSVPSACTEISKSTGSSDVSFSPR